MHPTTFQLIIVEDNPGDQFLLADSLAQSALAAYELSFASQLEEALRQLSQRSFDLALLDLGLPDSLGLATFTAFQAAAPGLPVIILSGLADEALALEAMQNGAQDYLVKGPAGWSSLERAIRYAIERQRIYAQLRRSEKYWRSLIEHSNDAIAVVGVDGVIQYESPAITAILGYSPDEVIGQTGLDLVYPADQESARQDFARILAHPDQPVVTCCRFVHKDGTLRWIEATNTNYLDHPEVASIVINYRDITAQKQTEEDLLASRQQLEALVTSLDDIVFEVDEQGTYLNVWVADERLLFAPRDQIIGRRFDQIFGAQAAQPFFETLERVLHSQAPESLEYPVDLPGGQRWFTARYSPIHSDDPARRSASILVRDTTERHLLQERLRQSEERFSSFFYASPVPMGVVDASTARFQDINEAYERLSGYRREEVIGRTPFELDIYPDKEQLWRGTQQVQEGGIHGLEITLQPREGTPRTALVWSKVLRIGEQTLNIGTTIDVTERRQAQEALLESETRLRQVLDSAPDAIFALDREYRLLINNRSHQQALAASGGPLLRLGESMLTPDYSPEMIDTWKGAYDRALAGEQFRLETVWTGSDGQQNVFENSFSPLCDASGAVAGVLVVAHDITERKQAEQHLLEKLKLQEQLEKTASSVPGMLHTFKQHPDGRFSMPYASPAIEEIYGLSAADVADDAGPIFTRIDPRDIPAVIDSIAASAREMQPWQAEFRYQHALKGQRWFGGHSTPVRDEDGSLLWYGIIEDITARKQTEAALNEQRQKLARLLDILPVGVSVLDGERRLSFTNPALESILKLDRAALERGAYRARTYLAPDGSLLAAQDFASAQAAWDGQPVHDVETGVVTESGETIWTSVSAVPMDFPDWKMVVVTADITARKQAEQALRASEEIYRSLVEASDALVVLLDAQGRVVYANDKAAQTQGFQAAAAVGQSLQATLPAAVAERYLAWIGEVLASNQTLVHETTTGANWYRTSLAPVRDTAGKANMVLLNAADITPLKLAQQELQELNQSLEQRVRERTAEVQDLYDNAPAGYHSLDAQGRVARINQTELDWLGYTREQMLGRPMPDFLTAESLRIFRENFPRFMQTGRLEDLELEFVRQDGSTFPALVNASAIYDDAGNFALSRSTVIDMTERHRAEAALRESEAQNRLLFDESPAAAILFDETGQIMRLNRAAESLLGAPAGQIIGRTLDQLGLLSAELVASLAAAARQDFAASQNVSTQEFSLQRPGGEPVEVGVRVFPVQLERRMHYLVSVIDMTAHRKAEDTLRYANQELGRAMRMKDEFLASMSHELRTPLTGILGLSEILQMGPYGQLNEKQNQAVHMIRDSGQHLLELINDMLDLSKIEAGMLELEIQPLALEDICQASLQLVKGMAGKKRQQISLAMTPPAIAIQADGRRLKQMLVNLLSNAIKFTPEAGPIGLEVRASPAEQQVRLTVWDTGMGIAPQDLERLFQPFVQLDEHQAGTGLGLVLVKRLAELHGGTVSVTSAPGQGSRFTISLPWQPEPPGAEVANADAADDETLPELPNAASYVILLAEDSQVNILLIGDFLQSLGCRTVFAANGRQALEKAQEYHPDLILMDVQMPEMDGLSAIRRLRQDPEFARTPIIALTALAMPGDRERCLAAGASDYLTKPVRLAQLGALIRRLLEAR